MAFVGSAVVDSHVLDARTGGMNANTMETLPPEAKIVLEAPL